MLKGVISRKRAHEMRRELESAGIPTTSARMHQSAQQPAVSTSYLTAPLDLAQGVGHLTQRAEGGDAAGGAQGEEGGGDGGKRAPFRKDDLALAELTKDLVPSRAIVTYHKAAAGDARTLAERSNVYLKAAHEQLKLCVRFCFPDVALQCGSA